METAFFPIYMLWFVLFMTTRSHKRNHRIIIANQIINKTETEKNKMLELAKRFIEKECTLYTFDGNQYSGTIKEAGDGAVLIEKKGTTEAINLNFVVRIKEIRNK